MTQYFELFQANLPKAVLQKRDDGLSYISAGSSMQLAGRPDIKFVDFAGKPFLEMLGGAVVAVDITTQLEGDVPAMTQRTWLPIMGQDNRALPIGKVTLREVNDSLQRCLVKAIAMTCGTGMSVFMDYEGSGESAAKALAVSPNADLAQVDPVLSTMGDGQKADYVSWSCAVAACRITDPSFHWEVVIGENGLPFRDVLGGILIDVDVTYRGKTLRLSMPVWDNANDFQPISRDKVTLNQWNNTVMRCLTKTIAFNTGYGLSVYGKEGAVVESKAPAKSKKTEKVEKTPKADKAAAEKPAEKPVTPPAETAPVEQPVQQESVPVQDQALQVEATTEAKDTAAADTKVTEVATQQSTDDTPATKFRNLMVKVAGNDGPDGLISLFGKLAVSKVYAAADKPECFGILTVGAVAQMAEAHAVKLLAAVAQHDTFKFVPEDSRAMVAQQLATMALNQGIEESDEAVQAVVSNLIAAGLAADVGGVLTLANKLDQEKLDLVLDLVSTPA